MVPGHSYPVCSRRHAHAWLLCRASPNPFPPTLLSHMCTAFVERAGLWPLYSTSCCCCTRISKHCVGEERRHTRRMLHLMHPRPQASVACTPRSDLPVTPVTRTRSSPQTPMSLARAACRFMSRTHQRTQTPVRPDSACLPASLESSSEATAAAVPAAWCCCTVWAAFAALVAASPPAWLAQQTCTRPVVAGCPAWYLSQVPRCSTAQHTRVVTLANCRCQQDPGRKVQCCLLLCAELLLSSGGCSRPLCLHHEGGVHVMGSACLCANSPVTSCGLPSCRQHPSGLGHCVGGWLRNRP
jgi:hypothetical protein